MSKVVMIRCDKCSLENADTAQYCDNCGTRLGSGSSDKASVVTSFDRDTTNVAKISAHPAAAEARHQAAALTTPTRPAMNSPVNSGANSSVRTTFMPTPYAKLVVQRGRSAGKEFTLIDNEAEIGRWDADGGIFPEVDLDADDPEAKVSRRHARIIRRDNEFFIEDLGSTNGTFINRGRRLLPGDRQPLHDGDEVIIGKMFLRFYVVN